MSTIRSKSLKTSTNRTLIACLFWTALMSTYGKAFAAEERHLNGPQSFSPSPNADLAAGHQQAELEALAPLLIDPEMAQWARRLSPPETAPRDRLRRLSAALLDDKETRLEEILQPTYTAHQAFENRRANCVSYAALFVALAREMAIPAFFVLVDSPAPTKRRGTLAVTEGHLAAAWGTGEHAWRIYDFGGETTLPPDRVTAVTDLTAMALYASNRGVENLLEGESQQAVAWLKHGTHLDPSLVETWINLGVAQRRIGELPKARQAYEQALFLDPGSVTAYRNLAVLLHLDGRQNEAREILDLAEGFRQGDALGFLDLANSSLESGDLVTARGFYRRALRMSQSPR